MKLASFEAEGRPSYGAIVSDGVIDLGRRIGCEFPDLKALIARGAFAQARAEANRGAPEHQFGAIEFLPVIPNPEKIICVGLNYEEHRQETKREKTSDPALFVRFPESQVGHETPIVLPRESSQLDYEGEIAVVIGEPGRRIAEADAYDHIAGYACYNDGSLRDLQWATTQWTSGKNFPRTGAFGPWMTTREDIAPGTPLALTTRLNGKVMQHADTSLMIHSIPRLIAFISTFCTLQPGDVIVTGTPGGVGARRDPPVFMKPGDICEVEIDLVGVLRNPIVAEQP